MARRQVRQQISQWVRQHQADHGDDQAHPEGTGKDVEVDRLVRSGRGDFAEVVDTVIDSRQQVIRGDAAGVAAHRLPVGRVAPALIETFQRFFIRRRLSGERQGAGGFGQQAAVAGQFHVQALGQITQGLILAGFGEVFGGRFVNRFSGQAAAVPTGDGGHGARHAADHFRVAHAFVEQRHDRHQEHQQQKQHQRRDQGLGLPAVDPLGMLEPLLQGGVSARVHGNGDSHGVLRKSLDGRHRTEGCRITSTHIKLAAPCRSCRVQRGCDLLILETQSQKIAAFGSSYRRSITSQPRN
ncbi:hypothetical protein D3C71_816550 [compost metagenome]